MNMKEPLLGDHVFLADVASVPRSAGRLDIWWLGQSGFLAQSADRRVVFDPYLSDALTAKYAATDRPHDRMIATVISAGQLTGIDFITSTHAHTDHLDAATLNDVLASNPQACLVYPRATEATVNERVGNRLKQRLPLNAGEERDGFAAVPAAHDKLETDAQGNYKCLGYIARFGGFAVYHSGDGVVYPGMVECLRPFHVDVALLPINGKIGNMDGIAAARLAHEIGAKVVVPCHYDMFEFNTASPEPFVAQCQRLGQPYRVLQNGERLTIER
jgi:L-ascorbate metabolism protein UlaG (beta-lactamase superfamily)